MITISAQDAVDFLNSLLRVDPDAIFKILNTHVECTESLSTHPTVQVRKWSLEPKKTHYSVGFLGVLNGLFGVISHGKKKGHGFIVVEMQVDLRGNTVGIHRFVYQE